MPSPSPSSASTTSTFPHSAPKPTHNAQSTSAANPPSRTQPAPTDDPSKSAPFKHTRLPAAKHHPPPTSAEFWDVDLYLNRFVPAPRLHLLPSWIARFLGYRRPSQIQHPIPLPLSALSTLLGTLTSIIATVWIFHLFPPLSAVDINPLIIASLGANAVLEFTALSSPLAQPRALLLSSPLAAVIGVSISKAFLSLNHNPAEAESGNGRYEDLEWLAGALAVAVSAFVMVGTKTVHPPAGATALIAVVTPEGRGLGWWLVLLVFVGSGIIGLVALVVNNAASCRRWPVFWWTEHPLEAPPKPADEESLASEPAVDEDEEKGPARRLSRSISRRRRSSLARRLSHLPTDAHLRSLQDPQGLTREATEELDGNFLLEQELLVPRYLEVSYEEMVVLRGLRERLGRGSGYVGAAGGEAEDGKREGVGR